MARKLKYPFIRHQAGAHVAHMFSGQMSERAAQQIAETRSRIPDYNAEFLANAQLMADMEALADDPELLSYAEAPEVTPSAKVHGRKLWPVLAVAAALLVGLGFWFDVPNYFLTSPQAKSELQRYITRTGEQKTINLADGSRITLNTATNLMVENAPDWRRVMLQRGEAYFEVNAAADRPFTVELGDRSVSVLGTAFNIRKTSGQFTLAVMEGSVALHPSEGKVTGGIPGFAALSGQRIAIDATEQWRLSAGMVAEFDASQQTLAAWRVDDVAKMQSWREGILQFDDEPLYKVVKELNRYSGTKIIIEEPGLMELEIYAALKVNDLRGALNTLEHTLPIKVVYHYDRIAIIHNNNR